MTDEDEIRRLQDYVQRDLPAARAWLQMHRRIGGYPSDEAALAKLIGETREAERLRGVLLKTVAVARATREAEQQGMIVRFLRHDRALFIRRDDMVGDWEVGWQAADGSEERTHAGCAEDVSHTCAGAVIEMGEWLTTRKTEVGQ